MLSTRKKIAIAAAVQRILTALPRMLGRHTETVATRSGICWALDLNEGIDFSIWLLGAFERRTVAAYTQLVRPDMTVFDIGANVGAHTLPLARLVGPKGRVVAVEPTAWAVARLRANLQLNQTLAAVVDVRPAMLVASDSDTLQDEIYASWPLHGRDVHPTLRAQAKSTTGARAVTLDRLVREIGVDRVDFIKLDVDGHECAVLRGGAETLRRDHPTIILELAPYILGEGDDSFASLLSLLSGLGYRLQKMTSRQPLPFDPAALGRLIPDGGSINVVAVTV